MKLIRVKQFDYFGDKDFTFKLRSETDQEAVFLQTLATYFPPGRQAREPHHEIELVEVDKEDDEVTLRFLYRKPAWRLP